MEEESPKAIEYVKGCIVNYKTETFKVANLPEKIDKKTAKGILDPIYKTVKGKKSNSD